jgi:hypothetical protein
VNRCCATVRAEILDSRRREEVVKLKRSYQIVHAQLPRLLAQPTPVHDEASGSAFAH